MLLDFQMKACWQIVSWKNHFEPNSTSADFRVKWTDRSPTWRLPLTPRAPRTSKSIPVGMVWCYGLHHHHYYYSCKDAPPCRVPTAVRRRCRCCLFPPVCQSITAACLLPAACWLDGGCCALYIWPQLRAGKRQGVTQTCRGTMQMSNIMWAQVQQIVL